MRKMICLMLAAMLLLAFGTLKAQDTINAPRKADTTFVNPNMPELQKLLAELGVTLEQLSDSVDWEQFERDMERWGAEMGQENGEVGLEMGRQVWRAIRPPL